jgi:hypothetical protein
VLKGFTNMAPASAPDVAMKSLRVKCLFFMIGVYSLVID